MTSKQALLVTALTLLICGSANGQWGIENLPVRNNLNSIDLYSEDSGWIVGDNGTILFKLRDKWMTYPKITDEDLYSICLVGRNDGWIVGANGKILRFDGFKWEEYPSPTKQKLLSVSFRDADHGLAAGTNGVLLVYEKGLWQNVSNNIRGNIYSVNDTRAGAVLAGGLECRSVPIMSLSSGPEKKPVKTYDPGFVEIKSIMMPESSKMWAVGNKGTIIHFDGTEWNKIEMGEKTPTLNSVFFKDDNHGIAVGYCGIILTCSPEGWFRETSPTDMMLNDAAISGNMYYAVGDEGTLISKRFDPAPGIPEVRPVNEMAVETYPNPAREKLNVIIPGSYEMMPGRIIVTNLYGQVVYMKEIDSMAQGQTFEINTSGLSNGIYFVKIATTDRSTTGKFIVK
jgi:photosystem II stability/assembly factor-like uncharacterized protein